MKNDYNSSGSGDRRNARSGNASTHSREESLRGNAPRSKSSNTKDVLHSFAQRLDARFRDGAEVSLAMGAQAVDNLTEGFAGLKDFASGRSSVRGTSGQRIAATFVLVGTLAGGAFATEAIINREPRSAGTELVDDIRLTEIDTGRNRFLDRAARVEYFQQEFYGILSDQTLEDFEWAIKNPKDGKEEREKLIQAIDEVLSIATQASVAQEGDEAVMLQVAGRLKAFTNNPENKNFFGESFDPANPGPTLDRFLGAFSDVAECTRGGAVPGITTGDNALCEMHR